MPTTKQVRCANCYTVQLDAGKGKTCEKCGCSPLPSYSYPPSSCFHPLNCNGEGVPKPKLTINYTRRTSTPRLKL